MRLPEPTSLFGWSRNEVTTPGERSSAFVEKEIDRAAMDPALRGRAQVGDEIHRVRGRTAVPEGEHLAAGVERAPHVRGGRGQLGAALGQRLRP